MGTSRRVRKAHGRKAGTSSDTKQSTSKLSVRLVAKKSTLRHARKAALLATNKAIRKARIEAPPPLVMLLPLSNGADSELSRMCEDLQPFCNSRDNDFAKLCILPVARSNLTETEWLVAVLDGAKAADIISLCFGGSESTDDWSLNALAAIRAQGLPTIVSLARGDGASDAILRKRRGRELAAESLGEDSSLRPFDTNSRGGCERFVRACTAGQVKTVAWRRRYGYMLIENATFDDNMEHTCHAMRNENEPLHGTTTLTLSGRVRGNGLCANQLLHITGIGSFRMTLISDAKSGAILSRRDEEIAESLASTAPRDPLAGEQTWPPEDGIDDANMVDFVRKRKIPKGFSEYQASWLPNEDDPDFSGEDSSDELSAENNADNADDMSKSNLDDTLSVSKAIGRDHDSVSIDPGDCSDGVDDDMEIDAEEVARVRAAARLNSEFPDEVDTPIDVPARVRFARYRGLKSFRTSPWDPKEQLPPAYGEIFQFKHLPATRRRVFSEAESRRLSGDTNLVMPGRLARITVVDVPIDTAQAIKQTVAARRMPVLASGMLRHENRRSVVHFGLQRIDDDSGPVLKAKTPLELHCGFVRFLGRPMFSELNANSDKHKMERYFIHGRYTVASFYGPAIYAPAPALLFSPGGALIASGSALGADPDRIILKRIVLTGYPYKTQKRRVVVKFMFFTPEDIRWFRPVELWTKLGRLGHILEPLGTHGRMKCIFDAPILHHDTVCLTLYKRVYPKLIQDESY